MGQFVGYGDPNYDGPSYIIVKDKARVPMEVLRLVECVEPGGTRGSPHSRPSSLPCFVGGPSWRGFKRAGVTVIAAPFHVHLNEGPVYDRGLALDDSSPKLGDRV